MNVNKGYLSWWTNGAAAYGNSIQGLVGHRTKIDQGGFDQFMHKTSRNDWSSVLGLGVTTNQMLRQTLAYESFGSSMQNIEKALSNNRFIHDNGKNYSQNFRGNKYISTREIKNSIGTAKFLTNFGRGLTAVSLGTAIYQFGISEQNGSDYASLTGSVLITGSAAIPIAGPFISIGLGYADSFGAFDNIYNYFGN